MISVIIPTFNRKEILPRAIDSVLSQTHSDFELLIVDDGSTDGTKESLSQYLKDFRVKYFFKKNGGVSSARNFGIKKAKGEYIAFLDSDDLFEKKKLEIQLKEMKDFDVEFSICNSIEVQENGDEASLGYENSFLFDQEFYAKNKIPVSGTFFMIKNEKPILFDEELPTSEDLDFTMRYLMRGTGLFVSKPLVKRYKSFDPVRLSSNPESKIKGLEARLELFKKDRYKLPEDLNEMYISRLNVSLGMWNFFSGNFKKGRSFLREAFKNGLGFKKKVFYKKIYILSYIPFVFNFFKTLAMFFWKKGLIKI